MMTTIQEWGEIAGQQINLYTLTNKNGTQVSLADIGAAIQSVWVKDKTGELQDVVLGYDHAGGYRDDSFYTGTIVGRYANRIAGGLVNIDGRQHQLTVKPGGFHHHGGKVGFNKKVWAGRLLNIDEGQGVEFSLTSPDGEEGFPGTLQVKVKYTLTDADELLIDFWAMSDKTTLINLTQHAYFNLMGHTYGVIAEHELTINAEAYLPVNDMVVPNGQLAAVAGTVFDFRQPKPIGRDINADDAQLKLGAGYDHSWVLKPERSAKLVQAAQVIAPASGRVLTVYTTEPALHFYTGNFLDDSATGKEGVPFQYRGAFCLETQNYPDAPNNPHFPSGVLRAGEVYSSRTVFAFGIAP